MDCIALIIGCWLIDSFITHADHLSECVESHAYETYDKFIKSQGGKT